MIVGTGIDLVDVGRMRDALERHGERFLGHVFTDREQAAAPTGAGKAAYFAARWAAKEAVAKALGTGIGAACAWTDIDIGRDDAGRPRVELGGAAVRTARRLGVASVHISLSHERTMACAVAVAEK